MRLAVAVLGLSACRIGFDPAGTEITATLSSAYPDHGADWNDYVANDGADEMSAADVGCDLAGTGFRSCLQGGEIRAVTITGITSCAGLVITDELGAFEWTCRVVAGTVTAYSRLGATKGLRDLVTASGWRTNRVIVDGAATAATEPAVWWTNPIADLPDNSTAGTGAVTLDVPGQIYLLSQNRQTDGYIVTGSGISLVTAPGVVLGYNVGATDASMIFTGTSDRLWLEADFNLSTAGFHGITVKGGRFLQIYRTSVRNGGNNGDSSLFLRAISNSQIRQFTSYDSKNIGIYLGFDAASDDNYFQDIAISSPLGTGVYVHFGHRNIFDGLIVANAGADGIAMGPYCDGGEAYGNTAAGVRVFNNAGRGLFINSNKNYVVDAIAVGNGTGINMTNQCGYEHGSTIVNAVSAFNALSGVYSGDHSVSYNSVVSIANGSYGFTIDGTNTWSNLAASDSVSGDLTETLNGRFAGSVLVTDASACTNPTAVDGLADATCAPTGTSTASIHYQGSVMGDFVAAVADSTNATPSPVAPSPGVDWLHFATPYRVWGRWGTPGVWTTGPATIIDLALSATGTKLFDNTGSVTSKNPAFVADAPCPSPVDGNTVVRSDNSFSSLPDQTYLTNAAEIVRPSRPGYAASRGNHDGLCESGESCLYTPNFGAYQGEGELVTCTFTDGAITGVTMYGYSTNGY